MFSTMPTYRHPQSANAELVHAAGAIVLREATIKIECESADRQVCEHGCVALTK